MNELSQCGALQELTGLLQRVVKGQADYMERLQEAIEDDSRDKIIAGFRFLLDYAKGIGTAQLAVANGASFTPVWNEEDGVLMDLTVHVVPGEPVKDLSFNFFVDQDPADKGYPEFA